jgi:hypothetical protein
LPVYLPGTSVPLAWAFALGQLETPTGTLLSQLYYNVYGQNGWSRKVLSTMQPTCSPSARDDAEGGLAATAIPVPGLT